MMRLVIRRNKKYLAVNGLLQKLRLTSPDRHPSLDYWDKRLVAMASMQR